MLSMCSFPALCALLPTIVASLALSPPQNLNSLLLATGPENATLAETFLLNPTISTILGGGKIDCDERRFGRPPVDSCRDAINQIPQDPRTMLVNAKRSYGTRGTGAFDTQLPKRWISCRLSRGLFLSPNDQYSLD